jgi:hypothetical protein
MESLYLLNGNTYLTAFSMLMMNMGSRYLALDISRTQERILKYKIVRRITIFCMFYVATRDVLTSFILMILFIILGSSLFNEQSNFCMLPRAMRNVEVDITEEEYASAKKTVELYEKSKKTAASRVSNGRPKSHPPTLGGQ